MQELALRGSMQGVQSRFTQRQNAWYHWSGHLWQGRFCSATLDESYFWHAIRDVERNPVRAGLVARAEAYPWLSAAAHCGIVMDSLLAQLPAENMLRTDAWSAWLAGDDGDEMLLLRAATASGRPCGPAEFVPHISTAVGRPLQAKSRGRPRKNTLR